jgi:exosortase H (IPTLxxWG-CTERM-specific)
MIGQMILFYILYYLPFLQDKVFSRLIHFYAMISSGIINVFGFDTSVFGDVISSAQFSISIKKGCDALEPMALVASGIVAFPSPVRFKLIGLLSGLSFLFLLNITRIVTLFIVGIYRPDLFQTIHIDVWQIVFILSGIGYWFFWIRKVVSKKKSA